MEEISWFTNQVFISGINFYIHGQNTFLVSSDRPLKVLGSSVLGGDLRQARYIINHSVDKDYSGCDPVQDLRIIADELNLGSDVMGMMTAVNVARTFLSHVHHNGFSVAALCTAGIGNPGVAGMSYTKEIVQNRPGTINIVLIIDGNLTDAAMVNAVTTATEAKTRALHKAKICLRNGEYITGTTTDSIVVACTGRGKLLSYAGTATKQGYFIGRTVFESVMQGIGDYLSFPGSPYKLGKKQKMLN